MYRISAGQSMCGGSVDWHHEDDGSFRPLWGVQGSIQFETAAEAEAIAEQIRKATGKLAYAYLFGEWAPPPEQERLTEYSPRGGE